MVNSVILKLGRTAADNKASYVPIWANCLLLFKMYVIIIESFVFSGLSRNRCMNNLSVSKSCSFDIRVYILFVVGITGGSIKFLKADLSSGRVGLEKFKDIFPHLKRTVCFENSLVIIQVIILIRQNDKIKQFLISVWGRKCLIIENSCLMRLLFFTSYTFSILRAFPAKATWDYLPS